MGEMTMMKKMSCIKWMLSIAVFLAVALLAGAAGVTAKAEEFTLNTFSMQDGAQVRKAEPIGLRFCTEISEEEHNNLPEDAIFGTLVLPTHLLGGEELTLNTPDVRNIVAKIWREDAPEGKDVYSAVLVGKDFENYSASFYNTEISARSYVKYRTDGGDQIVYTPQTISRSIAAVANSALLAGEQDENNILTEITAAAMEEKNVTLTFKTRFGSEIAPITAAVGTIVPMPEEIPQRDGYEFVGWADDITLEKEYDFGAVTKDTIVYAKWERTEKSGKMEASALAPAETPYLTEILEPVTLAGTEITNGYKYEKVAGVSANIDGSKHDPAGILIDGSDAESVIFRIYSEGASDPCQFQVKKSTLVKVIKLSDNSEMAIQGTAANGLWFDIRETGWYEVTIKFDTPAAYIVHGADQSVTQWYTGFTLDFDESKFLDGGDYDKTYGPAVQRQSLSKIDRFTAEDLKDLAAFAGRNDTYAFRQIKDAGYGSQDGGSNGLQAMVFSTEETGAIYESFSFDLYVAAGSEEKPVFAIGNDEGYSLCAISVKNAEGEEQVLEPGQNYVALEKGQWYTVTADISLHGEQCYYFGTWSGHSAEFYYTDFTWTRK